MLAAVTAANVLRVYRDAEGLAGPLFDLAFLVDHVLAHYRVEFLNFHFVRHVPFVLGRRVKVPSAGARV